MKANRKNRRLYMIINACILIALFSTAALLKIIHNYHSALNLEILNSAKSLFQSIELAREWNDSLGGVYAEKNNIVISNPFISKPDITSVNGIKYTLKNSSIMTLEMAKLPGTENNFSYNLKSLHPINNTNAPDTIEKEALELFTTGVKEYQNIIKSGDKTLFRYISPLYARSECISCHGRQGYKTGDVLGAISINMDISYLYKKNNNSKYSAIMIGILSLFTIACVLTISTRYLKSALDSSEKKIQMITVTDELTSLFNRNYFFQKLNEEFERARRYNYPLSLIISKIDNFKTFNEKFGYMAGDLVLKNTAYIIKPLCRESDIISRYGEDEFAVILPNTGEKGALVIAEKLRVSVEEFKYRKDSGPVTISLGISTMSPDSSYSAETLIYDADTALYRSQESGSNRAILYKPL